MAEPGAKIGSIFDQLAAVVRAPYVGRRTRGKSKLRKHRRRRKQLNAIAADSRKRNR